MADSSVAVTAGSGTAIDTRTEDVNSNHRQVVVIGDPSSNAGVASVDATTGLGVNVKALAGNAVATGAGAVASGVQRNTLASDDPAVVALQIMDDWDESDRAKVNLVVGQAGVAAGSGAIDAKTQRITLATDDPLAKAVGGEYETVAASATTQTIGATGATGDYLGGVLIIPATTSPGAVAIKDGAGGAITIFTGGTGSVSNLVPFFVPLGIRSGAGAWQVTTGANVSAIAVGDFT